MHDILSMYNVGNPKIEERRERARGITDCRTPFVHQTRILQPG